MSPHAYSPFHGDYQFSPDRRGSFSPGSQSPGFQPRSPGFVPQSPGFSPSAGTQSFVVQSELPALDKLTRSLPVQLEQLI